MPQKQKVIFIVGPTAVGKSELAVKLAEKIRGEIISADSISIYRGMDIISSKPAKHLRKQIPHHLIDIINSDKEYNVAKFIKESNKKIAAIIKRKKVAIVAGGSGLYVDSLLYGLFKGVKGDDSLRARLTAQARKYGNQYLYDKLKGIDSEAAGKIHPNNLRRLIRALEVYLLSKRKFSEIKQKRSGLADKYAVHPVRDRSSIDDRQSEEKLSNKNSGSIVTETNNIGGSKGISNGVNIFGLNLERNMLYQRIDERVDKMFKQGLVNEVRRFLRKKLAKTARQALGIKEIEGCLKGEYDLEKAKYLLKRNTRHFAKRQLTWFRRNKEIIWLDAGLSQNILVDKIIGQIYINLYKGVMRS